MLLNAANFFEFSPKITAELLDFQTSQWNVFTLLDGTYKNDLIPTFLFAPQPY